MKRSEMVEKIRAEISSCEGHGVGAELAEFVLDAIEEAGMLPPGGVEVVSPSIIYYRPEGNLEKYEESYDVRYLWEPEETTKEESPNGDRSSKMSKVYDDYLEKKMEADDILEEIHKARHGDWDQLESDLEDLKEENLRLMESNVALRGKLIKIMEVIGEADKSDGDNYFI